ncbi:MAG: rRNA maturation RNase YbeY, partial [Pseudomonadota bacterium]
MPHDIDILIEDDRWAGAGLAAFADAALHAVLDDQRLEQAGISLLACDDARIATLNAQFREKPTPTNVLSWPEDDLGADQDGGVPHPPQPDPDGTLSLGDIAIAYDTCAREAAEQGKPLENH